jgi:hypothetical protein
LDRKSSTDKYINVIGDTKQLDESNFHVYLVSSDCRSEDPKARGERLGDYPTHQAAAPFAVRESGELSLHALEKGTSCHPMVAAYTHQRLLCWIAFIHSNNHITCILSLDSSHEL